MDDEDILEMTLSLNDDLQQTFTRFENLQRHKYPAPFISIFTREKKEAQPKRAEETVYMPPPKKHKHRRKEAPKEEQADLIGMMVVADTPPVPVPAVSALQPPLHSRPPPPIFDINALDDPAPKPNRISLG